MNCPNCGANIKNGSKFCEYCGSQISLEMRKELEQVNKQGCPKCGSSNVKFEREKQGELRGKKGMAIVRTTVGMCNDCGYTWQTNEKDTSKKSKTWLWVLGWILIFPVPLTIILLRNKEMKQSIKYGIITIAWIVYLLIAWGSDNTDTVNPVEEQTEITNQQEIQIEPNINTEDGTVLFGIISNFEENTELTVMITNNNGYSKEQNVIILNDGKGYTSEFDEDGKGLNGDYTLTLKNTDGHIIYTKDFSFNEN